jgi:ferritin-like metal-binding protein YciE
MAKTPKKLDTMDDLFWMQMADLYSAEEQLTEAMPKMIAKVTDPTLRKALERHLKVTEVQFERLQQIYDDLGHELENETCKAMKGLIAEGEHVLEAKGDDSVRDAGIIAAAQRVEHYEISACGSACALAIDLGHDKAAALLQITLSEEKGADAELNQIAKSKVNQKAARA